MFGWEGLVDIVVKIVEIGYMVCWLMKVFEDLCIYYDLSVRNLVGGIV